MSSDDSDRIAVAFLDTVRIQRDSPGNGLPPYATRGPGMLFGDWYVHLCTGPDAIVHDPDSNFDVGHHPTGLRLGNWASGLTFWEARRVAMAMDDAGIYPAYDEDIYYIVQGIVAAALMDHYVFPLANHLSLGTSPPWG